MNQVARTGLFRTRLLALVLLITIPAFVLSFLATLKRQRIEKEHARERAVTIARLAAAHEAGYVRETQQLLATVGQFPVALSKDQPTIERGLRSIKRLSPNFGDIGLVELDGSIFAHTLGTNVTNPVNLALIEKARAGKEFSAAPFRFAPGTNNLILQFASPVFGADGQLARVIYASLKTHLLTEALVQVELPPGGVANVFDPEGTLLARYPDPDRWAGRTLRHEPFFQKSLNLRNGVFDAPGLDGIARLYAVTVVEAQRKPVLFVTVGVPRQEYFAEANKDFAASAISLLGFAAILLLAARLYTERLLVRPITAILAAADRITRGDFQARTGLGSSRSELHLLAQRFDEMAASLEKRQSELANANEEIRRHNLELERRVAERTQELQALNGELEAFSYSVSHDLRAPLRHMDGFAQLLLSDPKLQTDPRTHRHLTLIAASAKQMGALIDSLLAFSQMGRQSMRIGPVNFAEMVSEIVAETTSSEPQRQIEWKIGPLPQVQGDAALLRQVWRNLISNAIKYTRERIPAVIEITCEHTDREFLFSIRDNGAGFDMTYAGKLFGVFQRLHRNDEFEGTGIGLANVRRIISRHGGRTWAEGKTGQGATFSFSLPRTQV